MSWRRLQGPLVIAILVTLAGCSGRTTGIITDTDTGDESGVGNLTLDPCGWDFGAAEIDTVTSKSITAVNVGDGPIVITGISSEVPFAVSATTPVTVGEGSSYQFSVRFEPTGYGDFGADLLVVSDDLDTPELRCPLSGSVTADADGDGYETADAGGPDCDDDDAEVYPGAIEVWYDGVDQDCDGASDFDQDGDRYDSEVFYPNVGEGDPSKSTIGGGDCQDVDYTIYPGASDAWYDGVDSNCDGINDYDKDADTWPSDEYGGEDCDDDDPDVNPGADEAFNGLDDNCNGSIDDEASADEAAVVLYGDSTAGDEQAGTAVAVGDYDGNGTPDMAIGSYYHAYSASSDVTLGDAKGRVSLFMNGNWTYGYETDDDADHHIDGAKATHELGRAVATVGDWDDDGLDDLAVGAWAAQSKAGRVYLFSGADLTTSDVDDAVLTIDGEDDFRLGYGLGEGHDLDADGLSDLVVYGVNSWNVYNYLLVQYGGGDGGTVAWDDADATWRVLCGRTETTSSFRYCGGKASYSGPTGGTPQWAYSAHHQADLDGDGYSDLLLGDKFFEEDHEDGDPRNLGRVWVLWGRHQQYDCVDATLDSTATILAEGWVENDQLGAGVTVAEDGDGDGDDEIWIHYEREELLYNVHGGTDLRTGGLDLEEDADATVEFRRFDDVTGFIDAGDWTGDGVGELGVAFGEKAGRTGGYIYFLPGGLWSGSYDGEAMLVGSLVGESENGVSFGFGIPKRAVDLDGDDQVDLVAGDPGYNDGQGAVFLFYNAL